MYECVGVSVWECLCVECVGECVRVCVFTCIGRGLEAQPHKQAIMVHCGGSHRRFTFPFRHYPAIYICTMSARYFYIHRRGFISITEKKNVQQPSFEIRQF